MQPGFGQKNQRFSGFFAPGLTLAPNLASREQASKQPLDRAPIDRLTAPSVGRRREDMIARKGLAPTRPERIRRME